METSEVEIVNAIVERVSIDDGDLGLLTAWLFLDYGDCHQGFGGYSLYLPKSFKHHDPMAGFAGHFIFRCMEIAGVSSWENIKGKTIRVKRECKNNGAIIAIGHIVKDVWFNPKEDFNELKK